MKKVFTLLVALIVFSAVFAQQNTQYYNRSYNNWNTPTDNRNYNDNNGYYNDRPDHGVVITNDNSQYQHEDRRYNDNYRRAEMDHINRDYDRRINEYRNNRRLNAYDRDRYIESTERERGEKLRAFGGG